MKEATVNVVSFYVHFLERGCIHGLTIKQKKFADEYIISGNYYESAKKAGYSENYAKAQSYKLLENVGIKSYIDERMDEIDKSKIADQQEVMEFLTTTMRDDENATKDRLKAAELIGKRHMMWVEKRMLEADVKTVNNPFKELTTEELRKLIDNE